MTIEAMFNSNLLTILVVLSIITELQVVEKSQSLHYYKFYTVLKRDFVLLKISSTISMTVCSGRQAKMTNYR